MKTIQEQTEQLANETAKKIMKGIEAYVYGNTNSKFDIAKSCILELLENVQKPVKKYVLVRDTNKVFGCIACCMCINGKCKEREFTDKLCTMGYREDDFTLFHWEEVKDE